MIAPHAEDTIKTAADGQSLPERPAEQVPLTTTMGGVPKGRRSQESSGALNAGKGTLLRLVTSYSSSDNLVTS